jgi:hypothetical protein
MSLAKPLASLSPSLLARKGAARPAMRPQLAISLDDLGWNDHGDEQDVAHAQPEKPVVVQQIEALAQAVAPFEVEATKPIPPLTMPPPRRLKAGREVRSALQDGRKAAFTLRLDSYRHLRLRLACTMEDCSAQALVTEALDRFLADMPGLEDLARKTISRN